MKKRPPFPEKRCKVRINLKRFENIIMMKKEWGFNQFLHSLN